uniref:Uncharacterized protein n=1 Tax=Arundo donax TaxID=35708 RepID=A0A0A9E082_ARUDO
MPKSITGVPGILLVRIHNSLDVAVGWRERQRRDGGHLGGDLADAPGGQSERRWGRRRLLLEPKERGRWRTRRAECRRRRGRPKGRQRAERRGRGRGPERGRR